MRSNPAQKYGAGGRLAVLFAIGLALAPIDAQLAVADDDPLAEARKPVVAKFKALDTDQDGKLSVEEFSALGGETERPRLARDFRVLDLDRDGRLIFEEFLNTPGVVPAAARGRLPDPLTELVERWMSKIQSEWKGWDKNADGELSREEFAGSGLARLVPGLESAKFDDWNRDKKKGVSRDDCRRLLDAAFGVRRLKGEPLRFESGIVVNAMLFGEIDRDHSDQLEHDEFVSSGFDGALAEDRFRDTDADHDGIISFAEWTQFQFRWIDSLSEFLRIDADLDGRIDEAEFLKAAVHWQKDMARHVFPGFDMDRDGFLSLEEYRRTPFVNLCVMWTSPRHDSDNDGLLSRGEFQWGRPPELGGIEAEYFRLFDLNQDGRLDQDEFPFITSNRDPKRDFPRLDADRDGSLNEAELVAAVGGKTQSNRVLRLFDLNGDRQLSYDEF